MIEQFFSRIKTKWLIVIILVFTVLFFLPVFWFDFLSNYDDESLILQNMVIRDLSLKGVFYMFSSFVYGLYHPLVTLSFAVDYFLYGLNPAGYHFTNILIHAVNCILIFYVLRNLFPDARGISFFISLVFIFHPLHVESVVWVSGRKDLLYVLFYLLGLLYYVKFNNTKHILYYFISLGMFLMSLFSKSAAVSFPLAILVIYFIQKERIISRLNILRLAPFFALSLLFGIINIKAQQSDDFIRDISGIYNIFNRVVLVLFSFYYYIQSAIFPLFLSPKHFYPELVNGFLPAYMYIAVFVMALLLLTLYLKGKLNRMIVAGILFYFVSIFFMLKFIPTGNDFVSDRYAYLAVTGIFFPLFLIKKNIRMYLILGSLLLVFYCMISFSYMFNWKNSVSAWTKVLEFYPKSYLAYNERGQAYFNDKNLEKAVEDLQISIQLKPSKLAYMNLGLVFQQQNKQEKAIHNFWQAQKMDSSDVLPFIYSSKSYFNINEFNKAEIQLLKALKMEPENVQINNNLGIVLATIGEYNKAGTYFSKVLTNDPYHYDAYLNLIKLQMQVGNYKRAMDVVESGLRYFKNDIELLKLQAEIFAKTEDTEKGINILTYLSQVDEENKNKHLFKISNIYIHSNEWVKALNILKILHRNDAKNQSVMVNIGNCYFKLNRIDSACYYWNLAYKSGLERMYPIIKQNCK